MNKQFIVKFRYPERISWQFDRIEQFYFSIIICLMQMLEFGSKMGQFWAFWRTDIKNKEWGLWKGGCIWVIEQEVIFYDFTAKYGPKEFWI